MFDQRCPIRSADVTAALLTAGTRLRSRKFHLSPAWEMPGLTGPLFSRRRTATASAYTRALQAMLSNCPLNVRSFRVVTILLAAPVLIVRVHSGWRRVDDTPPTEVSRDQEATRLEVRQLHCALDIPSPV